MLWLVIYIYQMCDVTIVIGILELFGHQFKFKLLNQGYKSDKLKVAIKNFCGRYIDLFGIFGISVLQFTNDLL